MDLAHQTLQKRLGKEVTPETINEYLHILNHAMPGAAVVQEHMVETHPALVADDCYVKVFTGDDELADDIEPQFLLNIDKLFPAKQAEALKAAVGKSMWQAIHIPTIVSRTCDGGTTSAGLPCSSVCPSSPRTACAPVRQPSQTWHTPPSTPASSRWPTSCPLAVPVARTSPVASSSVLRRHGPGRPQVPERPRQGIARGRRRRTMLFDQIWLGSYMSGGVGFTQYATAAYTDNILDDFTYYGMDYIKDKYKVDWKNPNRPQGRPRSSSTTSQPRSPSTRWSSTSSSRP
jgi:methyl-coenzyme M reductase alpha subunit